LDDCAWGFLPESLADCFGDPKGEEYLYDHAHAEEQEKE
jgi:hypothetical protein